MSPENRLDPVVDIDFLKDVVKVGFDGMGTDAHPFDNHLIRCAHRERPQQLDLAFGQGVTVRLKRSPAAGVVLNEFGKDPPGDPDFSGIDSANPVDQVLGMIVGIQ